MIAIRRAARAINRAIHLSGCWRPLAEVRLVPASARGTHLCRIIERHLIADWGRLFGYAMTLTGNNEAARDLLQQCAVQSLSSASPPRSEQSVRPWLFRILCNLWIDQHRRTLVRNAEPPPAAIEHERWHYDGRLIAELTVRERLARIEPMHREIIRLVDLFGFRYAEPDLAPVDRDQ